MFLLVGYDRVAAFTSGRTGPAVDHARQLLTVERVLHLAVELRLNRTLAPHVDVGRALSVYYDFAHGMVTMGVLGLLYVCRPAGYRSARTALLTINVAALVVFAAFPVAPPRLLPHSGFTDVVVRSHTWGSWESATSVAAQHANLYAAFPSLHVAAATWVLLAVRATTRHRMLRGLALAHVTLTVLIVVSTGNHYLLDVAAGTALTAVATCAVRALDTRRLDTARADRSSGDGLVTVSPPTSPAGSALRL